MTNNLLDFLTNNGVTPEDIDRAFEVYALTAVNAGLVVKHLSRSERFMQAAEVIAEKRNLEQSLVCTILTMGMGLGLSLASLPPKEDSNNVRPDSFPN